MAVQTIVFFACAFVALIGAGTVIWSRSPVHSALGLVATLFAIAVLFLNQNAQFLAAVQVIVYTGAIVILILFVIMLLGADRHEDLADEPLGIAFRVVGGLVAASLAAVILTVVIGGGTKIVTGNPQAANCPGATTPAQCTNYQPISKAATRDATGTTDVIATADGPNINLLGKQIFTKYIFAFEVTAALLTIAVVGAVLMARREHGLEPIPEEPESLANGAELDELSEESHG
jgi:NADH-quinone oxidoreductase subunit J